jgi:hypothetical protein
MPELTSTPLPAGVRASQDEWRASRRFLNENRLQLTVAAAELYPDAPRVGATLLLSHPAWLPPAPFDLRDVHLRWDGEAPGAATTGREPEAEGARPLRTEDRASRPTPMRSPPWTVRTSSRTDPPTGWWM